MNLIKVCALCTQIIKANDIVCYAHEKEYAKYEHELWMQELVKAQQRQFEIDNEENRLRVHGVKDLSMNQKSRKTHSKLTVKQKIDISRMFTSGMRPAKIARELKLSFETVRKHIQRNHKKRDT